MTPLTKKRIDNFKANKRGLWSLWIFGILLFLSLFAEFIANDKPIYVQYDGKHYFPVIQTIAETEFGGIFETEADYKDSAVRDLITAKGFYIMPPIEYAHQFSLGTKVLAAPSGDHILGTDDMGRDVAARLIYGFRLSVLFGLALTIASSIIGIIAGSVQGYFGGKIDLFMQRFMEIWSSMPLLFILIILASIVDPTIFWLFFIMLLFSWMKLVDLVRAEFLRRVILIL